MGREMLLHPTEPTGRTAARGRGILWEYPMSRDGKKSPFGSSQQSSQMAGDKSNSENSTICLQLWTYKKHECSGCLSALWSDVEQLEQSWGHGHTLSTVCNVHVQDVSLLNVPKEEFIYSPKKARTVRIHIPLLWRSELRDGCGLPTEKWPEGSVSSVIPGNGGLDLMMWTCCSFLRRFAE